MAKLVRFSLNRKQDAVSVKTSLFCFFPNIARLWYFTLHPSVNNSVNNNNNKHMYINAILLIKEHDYLDNNNIH